MTVLQIEHPDVFQKFMKGYHVIRRSDKFWAGLGCDLVIEQTLMRSLKSTGGLTPGSGMTEHQRAIWTMSSPVSSSYNCAMQAFWEMRYRTSEQHKEATSAKIESDRVDRTKLATTLGLYSPFSDEITLRNIITGMNANDDVNVHNLFPVGMETIAKMEGQLIFSYSHKRNTKVKMLASAKAVKVEDNRTIEPSFLFQRFMVVS